MMMTMVMCNKKRLLAADEEIIIFVSNLLNLLNDNLHSNGLLCRTLWTIPILLLYFFFFMVSIATQTNGDWENILGMIILLVQPTGLGKSVVVEINTQTGIQELLSISP